MKLSRTRSYKINMGKYESMEVSATISIEGTDLFDPDELEDMSDEDVHDALRAACEKYLDQNLDPELEQAAELSDPGSMLRDRPTPRRTEKARSRR